MIVSKNRYIWFVSGMLLGIGLSFSYFGVRIKDAQREFLGSPSPYATVVGSKWAEADYYRGATTDFDGWIERAGDEITREERRIVVEAYRQTMNQLMATGKSQHEIPAPGVQD